MDEKPLYQDSDLVILPSLDENGKVKSTYYGLQIVGVRMEYILPREELKILSSLKRPELKRRLENICPGILYDLRKFALTPDAVGVAAHCAYAEEERRVKIHTKTKDVSEHKGIQAGYNLHTKTKDIPKHKGIQAGYNPKKIPNRYLY